MIQPASLSANLSAIFRRQLFATGTLLAMTAGFSGLVVQIVYVRLAIGHFGATAATIGAMIAMALLGLSLGALTLGKTADTVAKPMKMLGYVFLVCGGFVALLALANPGIGNWLTSSAVKGNQLVSEKNQLSYAALTMLPINFLLGGTLPILVKIRLLKNDGTSFSVNSFGRFYAAETFGAGVGSIFAGFWSIPTIGLTNTLYLAAALLGICGSLAVIFPFESTIIAKQHPLQNAGQEQKKSDVSPSGGISWLRLLVLIAVALAGGASMGMEVLWQRFFAILFGSDTHSYSVVAACFLIGIAIGAALSSYVARCTSDPIRAYSVTIVAVGFAAVCATGFLIQLINPETSVWASQYLNQRPLQARIIASVTLMIVPTTLIGMALPLAAHVWIRDSRFAASRTGQIYAAALFGNVVGILICGYWLVPAFGLRKSMFVLSLVAVATGVVLNAASGKSSSNTPGPASIRRLSLLGITAALVVAWGLLSLNLISKKAPLGILARDSWNLDFYSEGPVNTVAVLRSANDRDVRRMVIDGITIGESGGGVDEKQQMLAHLPFLVRPEFSGQRVLTIGLGTGILAGAIAENPDVAELICVELSPTVIAAAACFEDLNGGINAKENIRVVAADGIRYLRRATSKFDVIVSDAKSRPGHAGNVAFFSKDYYQLCNSQLSDNGVFVQWVSLETSNSSLGIIIQSFSGAFNFGHVAIAAPDSIYLVGSNRAIQLAPGGVEKYLSKAHAQALAKYDWRSFDDIASMYWIDQDTISEFLKGRVPVNTFDLPVLETYALEALRMLPRSITLENLRFFSNIIGFDMSRDVDDTQFNSRALQSNEDVAEREGLKNGRLSAQELIYAAVRQVEQGENWLDESAQHVKSALQYTPALSRMTNVAGIYRQLAAKAQTNANLSLEFSALLNISELKASSGDDELRLGEILCQFGKHQEALDHYFRATELQPQNGEYRVEFGFRLLELNKTNQAAKQFELVVNSQPDHALANLGLGIALSRQGDDTAAKPFISKALQLDHMLAERLSQYGIDHPR